MDHELKHLSEQIAAAIGRRDVDTLRDVLAPGFVHRSHDGERSDDEAFLSGIAQIPGEIRSVQLESLFIDECPTGALVSGVQRAQLVVNGEVIDDHRGFVDWFVRIDGAWRLQAALDFPE